METFDLQFRMDITTYKKLEKFCHTNGMEPNEYLNKIVKEQLDLAMYGDLNKKVKKTEPVDITPEPIKPIDATPQNILPEPIASINKDDNDDNEKDKEVKEEKKGRREIKVK